MGCREVSVLPRSAGDQPLNRRDLAKIASICYYDRRRRRVAQLAEQRPPNPQVAGSIPVPACTPMRRRFGALRDREGWQSGCNAVVLKTTGPSTRPRGFESHPPPPSRTIRGGRIVGLVRRFAKPLGEQSPRGFESLPPRHVLPVTSSAIPQTRHPCPLITSLLRSRRFRLIVHPFLKRSTYLPNNFFLP
jgi:hypothetical protein